MERKLQDTFDYSKNSASRKLNSSPPSLSSFAAEITTPYLVSYSSITIATLGLPIESTNAPVLPYSGKGYITTVISTLEIYLFLVYLSHSSSHGSRAQIFNLEECRCAGSICVSKIHIDHKLLWEFRY